MTLSVSGLGSGIDVDSLVSSLTSVATQPLTALQTKKSQIDAAVTTITGISSRLASLKTAALALSTSTGFASYTAGSSDAAVVASATGSAGTGSYSVSVSQLAQAQKTRSDVVSTSSTSALNQNFTLNLADSTGTTTVSIVETDSLTDIASKISASGARVSATMLNDGTGYRLQLQGLDTGSEAGFTMTGAPSSMGLTDYQSAQDALLTVDGLPITSHTNQVTGAIAGVKLALTNKTTSPSTITVSSDPSALESKLSAFMAAYNTFVSVAHSTTGFGSARASNSVLAADTTIRGAVTKVSSLIGRAVPGTTGAYTTLGSVGIKSNADGTLSMDNAKLEAALAADPASVAKLFVTDTTTGSTGVMQTMMDSVDALIKNTNSPITARIASLGKQSSQVSDSATKMQDRIDRYTTNLRAKFSAMDTAVAKYNSMLTQVTSIK